MRNVAGFALTWASVFIAVVAIMVDSPALFYMGTALIATIGACRFQAWLACKGLRFDRVTPESVHVGELVSVEITVWSERKIRRPLITVHDRLTSEIPVAELSPSLPIAPAFDFPTQTLYQFRPLKSGVYSWSGLTVVGTDALGLVTHSKDYETAPADITILPRPIPVQIELPTALGWGISEAQSGSLRGAGLEPWGVRQYVHGDSLRHVHWRSTARTGKLLVKEFAAGTHAAAAFLLQSAEGTDIGSGIKTSLELMKGHVVFLAETFLRQGARVELPGLDNNPSHGSQHERLGEIYEEVARVQAHGSSNLAMALNEAAMHMTPGGAIFVHLTVADESLPMAFASLSSLGILVVPMLYDARAFDPGTNVRPATDPEFVQNLRAAGATPIVMPLEVGLV